MSKSGTKQNDKSFKEHFDHVDPYTMDNLEFTEPFDHLEPPTYALDFTEGFNS